MRVKLPGSVAVVPKAVTGGSPPVRIGKRRRLHFRTARSRIRFAAAERGRACAAFQLPGEDAAVPGEAEGRSDRVGSRRAPRDRARAALRRRAGLSRHATERIGGRWIRRQRDPAAAAVHRAADRHLQLPIAATSSTQPSACSPGPTTTSRSPTRARDTGRARLQPRPATRPPATRTGSPHRPGRAQPERRLQPGQHDHHHDPRPRQPAGLREHRRRRPSTDMERYADPNTPVVVINADTGERQPIWAEIDYNPLDPATGHNPNNPADRGNVNLIIRPARQLRGGRPLHRRPAQPQGRPGQHDPARRTPSGSTATT